MKKKQYKVKIENGQIIPLEPLDIKEIKEGIIIFFDEELGTSVKKESTKKATIGSLSEDSLKKIWDNLENDAYNDL